MMDDNAANDGTISGRSLVIAMFTLAIVATGTLWTYWNMHLMPFMPLQETLAREFAASSPRVDGGRRKTHKGTPMILRVVMRVPYDPNDTSAKTQDLIETRINRTRELATDLIDLEKYDELQLHLYQEEQEQKLSQKTFSKDLK